MSVQSSPMEGEKKSSANCSEMKYNKFYPDEMRLNDMINHEFLSSVSIYNY